MWVARAVAMWLCPDHIGMTQPEIAGISGGLHYSAVTQEVRRIRSKVQSDHGLWELVEAVLPHLGIDLSERLHTCRLV